jgi:predicted secreted protein
MKDSRSKKLVLVCHCILNQNSKIEGIARFPGTLRPVADLLVQSDVGIYQMPCPEMAHIGIHRWSSVKEQYSSPVFRRLCRTLAERVADELEDYASRDYRTLALIGVDGSPSCGVDFTQRALGEPWGGRMAALPARQYVSGSGTYIEALRGILRERGLAEIPFIGIPEVQEVGRLEETLPKVETMLRA